MQPARRCPGPLGWSLLAAAWFGIVGVAFGALSFGRIPGQSPLIVLGGLGTLVVGGVTWWIFVERPGEPTLLRGTIVGASTGVIAHFVVGLFFVGWWPGTRSSWIRRWTWS